MKKIVLLTSKFPYNSGEEFLESEINELNSETKVYIYATDVADNWQKIRKFPANVSALNLFHRPIDKIEKIEYSLCSLFSADFIYCLMDMIKRKKFSIKNLKKTVSFLASGRRIARALYSKLKENDLTPDDTLLYSYWAMNMMYANVLLKRRKNYKIVTRCHDGDTIEQELTGNYLPLRRKMLEEADMVYAISNMMKDYILNTLKAEAKVVVSHLGTEDCGIREFSKNINGVFTIVSCATVYPIKRIDLIAKALMCIKDKPVKWIHFGGGGKEFDALRELSDTLPNNITTELRGSVLHDKIMEYYKNNDVSLFINVSSSEGIPVSVMEAMSFGIPVIATNVGGTSELVDNECGMLLSKDITPNALKDAIEYFMKLNMEEYIKYRKKARVKWKSEFYGHYNFQNLYEHMLKLI